MTKDEVKPGFEEEWMIQYLHNKGIDPDVFNEDEDFFKTPEAQAYWDGWLAAMEFIRKQLQR